MRLHVQASASFAESRDIHFPVSDSLEALVNAVGAALGTNVTEVLIWDEQVHTQAPPHLDIH